MRMKTTSLKFLLIISCSCIYNLSACTSDIQYFLCKISSINLLNLITNLLILHILFLIFLKKKMHFCKVAVSVLIL